MATYSQDFVSFSDFKNALKSWRGKGWIFYSGNVVGKHVELKTYNHTYMQIFRVNGRNCHLSAMDCKVSEFNNALELPFK